MFVQPGLNQRPLALQTGAYPTELTEQSIKACLHVVGGPQVGEVTRLAGGNPPVHISLIFDHLYMIGGVTRRMLRHLSGVPHLHVNSL